MADIYHIWADKKGDLTDHEWVDAMKRFLNKLVSDGKMNTYRITRCKLGFRSVTDMPEWLIQMEFDNLAQLDDAFNKVAKKQGALEKDHQGFNQFVADNIQHALFSDWPYDPK